MGRLRPKRGTFFWFQIYERLGISLVEVYARGGKSVIFVCKRHNRVSRCILWLKKSRKRFSFGIYPYFKDNAVSAV